MSLKDDILTRKSKAEDYLVNKNKKWTEYENLFIGKLADAQSNRTKSQVFDHKLSTMLMDRSARVMAQLAAGKVKAISKNDDGATRLMNLTLDKYIIPNANAQFDFLTKCRMMDLYSNIYGNYFAMVDWDVKANGYVGPDMWLLPIRDFFPQVGAVSLDDSSYAIVRTWRDLSWFEGLKKDKGFHNIDKVITALKNKPGDKQNKDTSSQSAREIEAYNQGSEPAKGKGYYEVLSQFEGDRWVDFVPSADTDIRDFKNPNDDGELPIVNKYSIPLIDDFMGIGDMERGKSMQYTVNSLWNLYLDGVKVSIFPPVLLNKSMIADQSSIKWAAAAKWLVNNTQAAQVLNLTPQGQNTFNNVYQTVTASLLNMFGTSDTATSSNVDPGFGKTPQALSMQANRENARDNVDRFYMEQFLTKVNKKFINMMSHRQAGKVQVRMFEEEIKKMAKVYPDIQEMWDENTGKLTINKNKTGSIMYDYEIVSGSTYAVDQTKQQQNLISLLQVLQQGMTMGQDGKPTSPLIEAMRAEGKDARIGTLVQKIVSKGGIEGWEDIIVDQDENGDNAEAIQNMDAQFQQMLQQSVNEIPAQQGMPQDMGQDMGGMPQMPPEMGGMPQ